MQPNILSKQCKSFFGTDFDIIADDGLGHAATILSSLVDL